MARNQNRFITANDGTSLFVKDSGGEGQPVLFVHSWSMNSDLWQFQTLHLSKLGFRAIAFDARAQGRSEDPGCGFDIETMTDDLAKVIETLDLQNVVLVGHSIGCSQILRYATKYSQDRISKIVLVGAITPCLSQGIDPALVEATLTRWETDIHGWIAENTDPFFLPSTPQPMKDWLWNMIWKTSLQAQIETNRSFFHADLRLDAQSITKPTLIIHGTQDASAPLHLTAEPTHRLIRNSELKIYEGATHGLFLTEVARFNQDLSDFIRQESRP